jgi:hypothetical protein
MGSDELTEWKVSLKLKDGRCTGVYPCFCGGSGSVELVNRVTDKSETGVEFECFTSRANSRPQSGLVLRFEGNQQTELCLDAQATWKGLNCAVGLRASVEQLAFRDEWAAVSDVFSSPRIRLGQLHSSSETDLQYTWIDPEPSDSDWYLLKLMQSNGQTAWSSPIWCRGDHSQS